MIQLIPKIITSAARALFGTAHSDILIFLVFKCYGAKIENGVSNIISVSGNNSITEPLKYLAWINDEFANFVEANIDSFDTNHAPLPSRPQGKLGTKYPLYFPIVTNARFLLRNNETNRSSIWTRGIDDWEDDNRYDIKPHESIIEVLSKEKGKGATVRLRPNYVYTAATYFGPETGKRCSIPWNAFVIWCCRNETFEEIPTFSELETRVKKQLNLSEEEIYHLFPSEWGGFTLSDSDFEKQRDDAQYNQLLCFGAPEIPTSISIQEVRTVEQLQFESQLVGLAETTAAKPIDLANRMWQAGNLNLLFTGAPRTGKSYSALQVAEQYLGITRSDPLWNQKILQVQFHQEWRYGDFIQKQVPHFGGGSLSFDPEPGVFLKHCRDNADGKSVVIIEEINRANVAAVFGESFYLMEMGYRGNALPLPHGGGTIQIPKELLLIATMNTIDRSTYALDYALLSRFRTIPFYVDYQAMLQFLMADGKFHRDEAYQIVKDIRQISEMTKYPIGQAHFVTLSSKRDLYDWYITVLRPALELFLTKYQEQVISGQVDPIMEAYRGPVSP